MSCCFSDNILLFGGAIKKSWCQRQIHSFQKRTSTYFHVIRAMWTILQRETPFPIQQILKYLFSSKNICKIHKCFIVLNLLENLFFFLQEYFCFLSSSYWEDAILMSVNGIQGYSQQLSVKTGNEKTASMRMRMRHIKHIKQ